MIQKDVRQKYIEDIQEQIDILSSNADAVLNY